MAALRITNGYANLTVVKSALGFSGTTTYDAQLARLIEEQSREIDRLIHRPFGLFVRTATLTFTPENTTRCRVDDLLTVTSLDDDYAANRTWSHHWDPTWYELHPYNARAHGRPYLWIQPVPLAPWSFYTEIPGSVKVAGTFGFDDTTEDTLATLNGAITAGATSVVLGAGQGALLNIGDRILLDAEQILVTDVNTDTLTVRRAQNGTTAASHLTAIAVLRYVVPEDVQEILITRVSMALRDEDAPHGVQGGSDQGTMQTAPAWDRRLNQRLDFYRRRTAA